jgi:hypothetical protein
MGRVTAVAAAFLLVAVAAAAQQPVQLQFEEGRVTLRAQNAPIRAILAEWARLGGATIVNGDRVAGPPVTLELTGVPERQALDIVLRSVAGYMLAPRRAGAPGASAFDRIMILPTSVAPRNPPPPAAAQRPSPVLPRPPMIARPQPQPPPEAIAVEEPADVVQPDDAADATPGDQVPAPIPGQLRVMPRPIARPPVMPQPGGAGPELVPDQPDPEVVQPGTQPGVAPTPTNPFGLPFGSSATPGVIAPAPRQQQQQQAAPDRVQ